MRSLWIGLGALAWALMACGGVAESGLLSGSAGDGGSGGRAKDTGAAGKDGGQVTVTPYGDSGVAAAHDTGTVVTPQHDASTIAVPDAKTTPPADTGTNPPPGVACGGLDCTGTTPICCGSGLGSSTPSASCTATTADCTHGGGAPITCTATTGCSGGDVCCASYTIGGGVGGSQSVSVTSVSCASQQSCQGAGTAQVCDPTSSTNPCAQGETCHMVAPGYGACYGAFGG